MRLHVKGFISACAAVSAVLLTIGGAVPARGTPMPAPPAESLQQADSLSTAFAYAAEVASPSVVSIRAVTRVQPAVRFGSSSGSARPNLPFDDDFLNRFFHWQAPEQGFVQRGAASGVVVRNDGYILTNNHVVADADELTVTLNDRQEYPAKVVATDPMTDLAVIHIDAGGLQPAHFGDSDNLRVGTWVLAVGDPFGLSDTITAGIVSAKGRSNVRVAAYEDFIQTDAAINPGNSGGPLVNLRGEVVGINTAIASRTGGNEGLGFAIPINMAKSIMNNLIDNGRVVRGFLGVLIQPLNEGLAQSFGFQGTEGVLIGEVTPGSPASKAGLKQGDIVTRYAGNEVKDVNQLRNLVAATVPNTQAAIEVFRDGKRQSVSVRIGELKNDAIAATMHGMPSEVGLQVEDLTTDGARELGYGDMNGALVTGVDPMGPAAEAGIQVNDVIVNVQGEAVHNASEFRQLLRQHDLHQGIRMLVKSKDGQRFVYLRVAK